MLSIFLMHSWDTFLTLPMDYNWPSLPRQTLFYNFVPKWLLFSFIKHCEVLHSYLWHTYHLILWKYFSICPTKIHLVLWFFLLSKSIPLLWLPFVSSRIHVYPQSIWPIFLFFLSCSFSTLLSFLDFFKSYRELTSSPS